MSDIKKNEEPSGFLNFQFSEAYDSAHPGLTLLVPSNRRDQLVFEARIANLLRMEAKEEESQKRRLDAKTSETWDRSKDANASKLLADAAAEKAMRPLVAGLDYDPALQHLAYLPGAPAKLINSTTTPNTPDKDLHKRDDAVGKQLIVKGPLRKIGYPDDIKQALDGLRLSQPHFAAVIDLVSSQLVMAERTGRIPRIPPTLLDGEPGLGKTHFALELAKVLGTTSRRISFDTAITSSTLSGSSRAWGNTQYGVIFEVICLGVHANPIIILDELDKITGRPEWNPLAPLHSLLEPSTAGETRDISLDFVFDTSLVTWIATSNDKRRLPGSLRSRFIEFDIERPDASQSIALAMSVINHAMAQLGDQGFEGFEHSGKRVAVWLAHLTAREIRQALEHACANAIANDRKRLTLGDMPPAVQADNEEAGITDSSSPSYFKTKDQSWLN